MFVTGFVSSVPALAAEQIGKKVDSCDVCTNSDLTYAACFNRLNLKWAVLYNASGSATAANVYLNAWNEKGLGSLADAQPYYGHYFTCDPLPDGRRAIFYY